MNTESRACYESRDIRAQHLVAGDVMRHEGIWRVVDNVFTYSNYDKDSEHRDLTIQQQAMVNAYLVGDGYVVADLRIEAPVEDSIGRMLVPLRSHDLVTVQVATGTIPTYR